MKLMRYALSTAFLLLFATTAQAQIDSTSPHQALPENEAYLQAQVLPAGAPNVYLRGACSLWGAHSENTNAMTAAFGADWTTAFYSDGAGAFSPDACFIYMEGGDDCRDEMNAYLNSNRAAIENWVANGGSLFINAAPNQVGDIDYGFGGVNMHSYLGSGRLISSVAASNPGHPVFAGPLPTQTSFTGNLYTHGYLTGPGMASILVSDDADADIAFSEKGSGEGNVMFGSMTTTNFHSPDPAAQNLRANMFAYGAEQCNSKIFEKEITSGNDYDAAGGIDLAVEVGIESPATYDFKINYNQPDLPPVQIEDTVPAEWQVIGLEGDTLNCEVASANKKDDGKSATKIVCLPESTQGMVTVQVDARCHGSRNNKKCRPTSCGALYLNNGAAAYELDPDTGEPVLDDEGNRLPPLLETNALCLVAVSDLNGGGIDYSGNGDEDGDGLLDHDEACSIGTDPCVGDSDGDGVSDFDEVASGCMDPLNPDTDGDTINDGDELAAGTDPCSADTDEDGYDDNVDSCPLEGPAEPAAGEILMTDGCLRQSQCSDGLDNEPDGNTDFPADASCDSILDDSEDTLDPTIPQACDSGTEGVSSGDPWVVCRADDNDAWISADTGGVYNAEIICQALGYDTVTSFGGTCGNTCGYCQGQGTTSCENPGNEVYNGDGASLGFPILTNTVSWLCVNNP